MTLEMLQSAKIAATKARDTATKRVLSDMIDACQKASITSKGRAEITEQLVDETLIKYQKTVQEMIDTCPISYEDKLKQYKADMEIVKQYAPQLITDKETIANRVKEIAGAQGIELVKANRGALMRSISAELKGKADMKIVSAIVGDILN